MGRSYGDIPGVRYKSHPSQWSISRRDGRGRRGSQYGEVFNMTEETVIDERPIAGIGTLVFGKWDAAEVVCNDPGLAPYVNLTTVGVPLTPGAVMQICGFGKSN